MNHPSRIRHQTFSDELKEEIIRAYFLNCCWNENNLCVAHEYYYNRAENCVDKLDDVNPPVKNVHFLIHLNMIPGKFYGYVASVFGKEFLSWLVPRIPGDMEDDGLSYADFSPNIWGFLKTSITAYPKVADLPSNGETMLQHTIAEDWLKMINAAKNNRRKTYFEHVIFFEPLPWMVDVDTQRKY